MPNKNIYTKIIIGGEQDGAETAINATISQLEQLRNESNKPINKIDLFEKASGDLEQMQRGLEEARKKLAYFREQAKQGGDIGFKAFASDIKATEKEIDKLNDGIKKNRAAVRSLSGDLAKAGVDTSKLASEKARLSAAAASAERGIIKLKGQLLEERSAAQQSAERTKQAGDAASKAGKQADDSSGGFGSLASGMKALAGAALAREFIQANASLESIEKSLEAVTGSADTAKREMEFIRGEAQRLGVETAGAASSFLTLSAATKGTNLEGVATREIWSAVAGKMATLGASSADVAGAMTQLAQGVSKGKFEMDDLKSISERIPGFFNLFAEALGVSTDEFMEMQKQGKITADLLPKLAEALGGTGGKVDTFNATLGRMKNALTEVATSIGNTGIFDAITWSMGKLADATSYATLGFKIMAARIKGDDTGLEKLSEQARAVQVRLFGIGEAAKKVADDVKATGAQVADTSKSIEQDVRNKIAGALISLDKNIENTADAFKKLGIDPDEIKTGISAAEREIISSFKRIAADPDINGQVLLGSLVTALDKVGKESVPEIGSAFKVAAKAGRQSAEEMATGVEILKNKLRDTGEVTKLLADAYKLLGITSQSELKKAAESAKDAYNMIVKSGAPLADQGAAWKAYAEAAIAANGGVASSILQAEAAQHGLTIAIDESGKASVRTKEVLESMADAARRAAQEVTAANTAAMESAAIAASQARTSIGTMQGSIDGFFAHLADLNRQATEQANAYNQVFYEQNKDIWGRLTEIVNKEMGIQAGAVMVGWEAMERYNAEMEQTAEMLRRQVDGVQSYVDALSAAEMPSAKLIEDARRATEQMYLLGEQDLSPLRTAIADAERRMLDLRDAAQSTLDSIQDEWDQLNNNLDEIEKRKAAKRETELNAQLAAAQEAGDRDAIADLTKALALLKQISAVSIANAAQREKDAATKTTTTTSTTATPPTSSGGVSNSGNSSMGGITAAPVRYGDTHIHIAGVLDVNDKATLDSLGHKLSPILKGIARLGVNRVR